MKNAVTILFLLSILFIGSCSKEGPIGPAGPQGAQGPQGNQGAQGAQGNANIIVKNFTLYPSDFTEYGTSGQSQHRYSATHSISEITNSVFDNGMVVVYYKSGTSWFSLPQTIYVSGYSYTLTYFHYVGGIGVQRYDSDLYSLAPSFNLELKVVIVPPASGKKEWNVDWNNYQAVKAYFQLKD